VKIGNSPGFSRKNPFVQSYKSKVFTFFNFIDFYQQPFAHPGLLAENKKMKKKNYCVSLSN